MLLEPTVVTSIARRRAAAGYVVLAVIWGVSFQADWLPFFPTVVVGGGAAALTGAWVRAAIEPDRRPAFPLRRGVGALVLCVTVAHLAIGHLLFAIGEAVLPDLTTSAAVIYARTGDVPLHWRLLLGAVVTAPMEEIYWRGALQPLTGATPTQRIVRGALLYAVFHVVTGKVALVAAAALGGLVWGWIGERTRSLGAAMLAHGLWTALMLLVPPV